MAFLELKFKSTVLMMEVCVNVILPESLRTDPDAKYKTLYLLHGLSDDYNAWMRRTAIERYAIEHGIAVVMPNAARSWYVDMASGPRYLTYIAEEVPAVCRSFFRGMSDRREDNMIAGLSMGGYGAMKIALTYPEHYGYCASLSGAMDIAALYRKFDINEWKGIFGFDFESATQLVGTKHDTFALARNLRKRNGNFPEIYLWCGESDVLLEANQRFRDLLIELEVPHLYEESEGNHSWKWWDLHIQDALKYFSER